MGNEESCIDLSYDNINFYGKIWWNGLSDMALNLLHRERYQHCLKAKAPWLMLRIKSLEGLIIICDNQALICCFASYVMAI